MSSVNEVENRINEIIDFLEQLKLDRLDVSIAIINMQESLRKLLVEYSKDYPSDDKLEALKRSVEKDGLFGEYIASAYNLDIRQNYVSRMKINTLSEKFRSVILSNEMEKSDEKFISLLADYRFLLNLRERATHLIFYLTVDEEERLSSCEEFIAKKVVS